MNTNGKRYRRAKYIIELALTGLWSANNIANHVGFKRTSVERILRGERNQQVFSDLNITAPIKLGQQRAKTDSAIARLLTSLAVKQSTICTYLGHSRSWIFQLRKVLTTRRPIIPVYLKKPVKDVHKIVYEPQRVYIQQSENPKRVNIYSGDLKQMTHATIGSVKGKVELTNEPHLIPQLPPKPEF